MYLSFPSSGTAGRRCGPGCGRVEGLTFISRGLGHITPRQEVNVRAMLLVKEELGPDSLDHIVPGTHGAGAAHHCGQNSLGSGQVSDGGVPCGGHGVDPTLEALQGQLAPRGDVVKGWWGTS